MKDQSLIGDAFLDGIADHHPGSRSPVVEQERILQRDLYRLQKQNGACLAALHMMEDRLQFSGVPAHLIFQNIERDPHDQPGGLVFQVEDADPSPNLIDVLLVPGEEGGEIQPCCLSFRIPQYILHTLDPAKLSLGRRALSFCLHRENGQKICTDVHAACSLVAADHGLCPLSPLLRLQSPHPVVKIEQGCLSPHDALHAVRAQIAAAPDLGTDFVCQRLIAGADRDPSPVSSRVKKVGVYDIAKLPGRPYEIICRRSPFFNPQEPGV